MASTKTTCLRCCCQLIPISIVISFCLLLYLAELSKLDLGTCFASIVLSSIIGTQICYNNSNMDNCIEMVRTSEESFRSTSLSSAPDIPNTLIVANYSNFGKDLNISRTEGVNMRIYNYNTSSQTPKRKVLIYFHGGGWVFGGINAYDNSIKICEDFVIATDYIVVNVGYNKAPEHVFPRAFFDSLVAFRWVQKHISSYGGDVNKVILGGESAGGNLAAALTSRLLDKRYCGPWCNMRRSNIFGLLLIYPTLEYQTYRESHKRLNNSIFSGVLSLQTMEWMRETYLGDNPDPKSKTSYEFVPMLTPVATFKRYPPTLVVLAESDVLYSEGLEFSRLLREQGVSVEEHTYPAIHGFFGRPFHHGNTAVINAAHTMSRW